MQFIIGSKTQRKVVIAEKVLQQFLHNPLTLDSYKAQSGVGETPWGAETYKGAENRAIDCLAHNSEAEYAIGLESGLVERFGHIFEEAWCCILKRSGEKYYGYSSGLKLPDSIVAVMKERKMEHFEVMQLMEERYKLSEDDTWGNYSGDLLSRDLSLEEALRNSLVQMIQGEMSFYHKEV